MSSLYVYVVCECQAEAERYGLTEQLNQLKDRVLNNQSLVSFDAFEYPYYVKKHIGYQYRLLARLDTIVYNNTSCHVLSFLKLYVRGNNDYEALWIKTKEHGGAVFQSRVSHQALQQFVVSLFNAPQTHNIQLHPVQYLSDYRTDTLGLSQKHQEIYYESPVWRYEIAPKLSDSQKQHSHKQLIHALENQKNTTLFFDNHDIESKTPPFTQYLPFIYHQEQSATFAKMPYVLGDSHFNDTQDNFYYRQMPLEFLLDEKLWCLSQNTQLPIQLSDFQLQCVQSLFVEQSNYPLIIESKKKPWQYNTFGNTLCAFLF